MPQDSNRHFGQEQASYGSRETTLTAVFGYAPQRVFNALEQGAERQGLTLLMSSAANGLLVARPPFSLLNLGRRITMTFSPAGPEATRVSACYTHGLVSFEDRYTRLELLNSLLRNALLQLEAGEVARKVAQGQTTPTPAPIAPAEPGQAQPDEAQPDQGTPAPAEEPVGSLPAYPTLNELRAKAQARKLAQRGIPAADPEAQAFLREPPEGFRMPGQFKARRVFWFALGVVLAVVVMVLLSLGSR